MSGLKAGAIVLHGMTWISLAAVGAAQQSPILHSARCLVGFSQEVQALADHISPAVVKIEVTRYGPFDEDSGQTSNLIGRQRGTASGVIVDPAGFILTNAHAVQGAVKVIVSLSHRLQDVDGSKTQQRRKEPAKIVGIDRESDLALLSVHAGNLTALPFASPGGLRQGDLVLAVGSPMGLRNSVSLGIVSATEQSIDRRSSISYIQTDASVNPGNSGGALVNMEGQLLGINTFILSRSGGNEGLGFAIPSETIQDVYQQLRIKGHVDRADAGLYLEDITPALAVGLSLQRQSGVVVSDLESSGPAEKAGIKLADIVLAIDGRPVESVGQCDRVIWRRHEGEKIKILALRSLETLEITVKLKAKAPQFDLLSELVEPEKNLVRRLGVLCVEIDKRVAAFFPNLRRQYGVIVAAKLSDGRNHFVDLQQGDVIEAINALPVVSLDLFRSTLDAFNPGDSVALQIERDGRLQYVAFELEE